MRQSQLFSKTRKDAPKDEVSKNAILLTRAGFIHKEMAGVYAYLPMGLRVLRKIENIIREEMNALGGQEIMLAALQEKDAWEKTDRWSDEIVDVWFKTLLKNGSELGLGTTHEEPLTALMTEEISSYRDLPAYVYQFQTKFRNELRAKSGILRGREFLMKDMYSFSRTQEEHDNFYERSKEAYKRIFSRAGIGDFTFVTFASGGSFSKYSHEFQTLTEAGEDIIHLSREKEIAVNKEVFDDEVLNELGLDRSGLSEEKAVEVGNIFTLGTRFSEPLGLYFTDENGEKKPVIMGSYGIGLGRLMGTVAEVLSDENGLVWPKEIAPFQAHLVVVGEDESVRAVADEVYKTLSIEGIEVLYDDRDARAGEKFADSDLMGIPKRIVVSSKTLEADMFEVKDRASGEVEHMSLEHLLEALKI
jgi:prolyl-tRNA synthetase